MPNQQLLNRQDLLDRFPKLRSTFRLLSKKDLQERRPFFRIRIPRKSRSRNLSLKNVLFAIYEIRSYDESREAAKVVCAERQHGFPRGAKDYWLRMNGETRVQHMCMKQVPAEREKPYLAELYLVLADEFLAEVIADTYLAASA